MARDKLKSTIKFVDHLDALAPGQSFEWDNEDTDRIWGRIDRYKKKGRKYQIRTILNKKIISRTR